MYDQVQLSRREREIMDAVFARGEASATQVLKAMHDPPSRTAVRTMLRNLVEKGRLTQRKVGRELFYKPTSSRRQAGQSAIRRVLSTFFDGSLEQAVSAHLADENVELSDDELRELAGLIRKARQKGN
jgi:predicted transcriptional regulator